MAALIALAALAALALAAYAADRWLRRHIATKEF